MKHLLSISGYTIATKIHLTNKDLHVSITGFSLLESIVEPPLDTVSHHVGKGQPLLVRRRNTGIGACFFHVLLQLQPPLRWFAVDHRPRLCGHGRWNWPNSGCGFDLGGAMDSVGADYSGKILNSVWWRKRFPHKTSRKKTPLGQYFLNFE